MIGRGEVDPQPTRSTCTSTVLQPRRLVHPYPSGGAVGLGV